MGCCSKFKDLVIIFVVIGFWIDFYIIKVSGIGEVEDKEVIDCYIVVGKGLEGYKRFVVVKWAKDFFVCEYEVV